jgi:hypothetical protein
MNVRDATRAALWCKNHRVDTIFRLRRHGDTEGLVADIL